MGLQLKNNATTTLAGSITSSATTFSVASGTGYEFPALDDMGDWFPVTVVDSEANIEVMRCTAINGDVLTVTRGEEGTTAASFAAGSRVDSRLTAAAIAEIQTNIANLQTLAATLAPLASPALTGNPTAPTQNPDDNSTNVATTAYVDTAIPAATIVFTLLSAAPTGWLMFDDGTLGSANSGASYAAANAQNVFNALYAYSDANAPLLTSGGVATTRAAIGNAAAAWAANCQMSLPVTLGRALAVAGSGAGLTARNAGDTAGEETHTLTTAEAPTGLHTYSFNDPGHQHAAPGSEGGNYVADGGAGYAGVAPEGSGANVWGYAPDTASASTGITSTLEDNAGGGAHNNIQPTTWLNAMVKL